MNTMSPATTTTNQALPAPASACALADRCAGTADRQAGPLRCASHAVSRAWRENRQKEQRVMATGPRLDADGHTLIVPSEWYDKAAVTFWSQHGFYYDGETSTWERDTRLPLHTTGKRYTAEVWLESTRKQFYQFWPTLIRRCRQCSNRFVLTNRYQSLCNDCTRQRQEAHDRYFSY